MIVPIERIDAIFDSVLSKNMFQELYRYYNVFKIFS